MKKVFLLREPFAFEWTILQAFLQISTRTNIFVRPLTLEQAFQIVDDWLQQPISVVIAPSTKHQIILRDFLKPLGLGGNLIADAHLATLAIEHGAILYSADNDFKRFHGLNHVNPLEADIK